jgi:mannan endo-1,6-alpha-mannosidase
MHFSKKSLASGLLLAGNVLAIDLDLDDEGSIRDAAKIIAASIVERYNNFTDVSGGIPGLFSEPYYFWEGGLAWDSLINYWHRTGDDSYNKIVGEALRHQLGENNDYMPANQTKSEGNDDQAAWALAAMTAAESGFPSDVLTGLNTTWADIAIGVFNDQASRWDAETCGGGLRWQIFSFNNGYDYKNTMSNGDFYQLASRLTRFTGNSTYEDWSDRVLAWSLDVGLIAGENATIPGAVFDGTDSSDGCSDINRIQWTASAGTYLAGAAYAWNAVSSNRIQSIHITKSPNTSKQTQTRWTNLHQSLVPAISDVFASGRTNATNGTITEVACAAGNNCSVDQLAFRAILARALAQARALITSLPPTTTPTNASSIANITSAAQTKSETAASDLLARIEFMLRESAKGAAAQCSGGSNGTTCGNDWSSSVWDGTYGLGQDLSALNVIVANLPFAGRIATANDSATEAGGSGTGTGTGGSNGTATGTGATGSSSTGSVSSSSHVAVSSVMLFVAVGSMMAFL